MGRRKVLLVFGTRPEAIKMAPVALALARSGHFETRICVTAQHREMLDPVLRWFDLTPDHDLNLMQPGQSLGALTARALTRLAPVLEAEQPDMVLVQGDTTTAMVAGLTAYYHQIPVGHIEAGLRTGQRYNPFPEEINRCLLASLTDLHFAPTAAARQQLLDEGIAADTVWSTGNTVIDALLHTTARLGDSDDPAVSDMRREIARVSDNGRRRLILITGHRRESFGEGFQEICTALQEIAKDFPEVSLIYPVHLNPEVQGPVHEALAGLPNVHLWSPVDYLPFVLLMGAADLILTDSGGIQEEAPSLGVPVLVMREATERMEGVDAGVVKLVGVTRAGICAAVRQELEHAPNHRSKAITENPYGDGQAAARIADILEKYFSSIHAEP